MKTKDIANQYRIDQEAFERFLERGQFTKTKSLMGISLADNEVEEAVNQFKAEKARRDAADAEWKRMQQERENERRRQEQKRQEEQRDKELKKQQVLSEMLISSAFSIEGYSLKKHVSFISAESVNWVNRDEMFKEDGEVLARRIAKARMDTLQKLKLAAYDLNCNAILGIDYDYVPFEPETGLGTVHEFEPYVICVTANGNAVVLEKTLDGTEGNQSNEMNTDILTDEADSDVEKTATMTNEVVPMKAVEAGMIICPICKTKQREDRSLCFTCGRPFAKTE